MANANGNLQRAKDIWGGLKTRRKNLNCFIISILAILAKTSPTLRLTASRGANCCACPVNLVWYEKPLLCACVGFPLENHERKEAVKYVRINNCSSIWDNLSSHFFFCNVDGSGKSLKLLCDVWKEVIFRMQKIVRVLSRDCLGDRWRWCYFWRMQVACRRVQKNWIVYFYRVIAISSYRWSFEVLAFL